MPNITKHIHNGCSWRDFETLIRYACRCRFVYYSYIFVHFWIFLFLFIVSFDGRWTCDNKWPIQSPDEYCIQNILFCLANILNHIFQFNFNYYSFEIWNWSLNFRLYKSKFRDEDLTKWHMYASWFGFHRCLTTNMNETSQVSLTEVKLSTVAIISHFDNCPGSPAPKSLYLSS